jgi:2-polyprenyl-3-methyl-5-hydroxy-6-metoxy-1,4-benzoquinol methylase
MDVKMNVQEEFWSGYYGDIVKRGNSWLDYSNERVQVQTFGLALDAAGPVRGKRCLDVGCGWGHFCRALSALGASSVTGVDIVPEVIAQQEQEWPHIRWLCGSLSTIEPIDELGTCDIAFLLEVLQYVPFPAALRTIWDRVLPGGRIVAVVPNARCSIVSRTRARFGASYAPPTIAEIEAELSGWPELEHLAYRGLAFRADQRLVPYEVSAWQTTGAWDAEPNRIQFVAIKRPASIA